MTSTTIQNTTPKGKWLYIKQNGFTERKWLPGYGKLTVPYEVNKANSNISATDKIIINKKQTQSKNYQEKFNVIIKTKGEGGYCPLANKKITIKKGMNLYYNVYINDKHNITNYTINNKEYSIENINYQNNPIKLSLKNIQENKIIVITFKALN